MLVVDGALDVETVVDVSITVVVVGEVSEPVVLVVVDRVVEVTGAWPVEVGHVGIVGVDGTMTSTRPFTKLPVPD